jgi:hypothetical protein
MKLLSDDIKTEQTQFGVAQVDLINSLPLDQGDKVTVVTSKIKRVLVVAVGLSLLITAGSTIGLDALLRRRARHRAAAAAQPDAADGDGADVTALVPGQRVNGKSVESSGARPAIADAAQRSAKDADQTMQALPAAPSNSVAPTPTAAPTPPAGPAKPTMPTESAAPAEAAKAPSTVAGPAPAAPRPKQPFGGEPTAVVGAPRAGDVDPGRPGQRPIVLEYQQSADRRSGDAAGTKPHKGGDDVAHDRSSTPSDATIVLPLSHKYWDVRNSGSKRS